MYFFHYFYSLNINKFINLRVGQVFGNYSNKQSILYKLSQSVMKNEKFTIYGHGKRTITYILEKDLILLIKKLIINNSKHLNINAITSSTNIKTLIKDFIKQNQNKKLIYEFKKTYLNQTKDIKLKKIIMFDKKGVIKIPIWKGLSKTFSKPKFANFQLVSSSINGVFEQKKRT